MSNFKKEMLKIKVKGYFDNGELRVDSTITALVRYYVDKARHNIETASLLIEATHITSMTLTLLPAIKSEKRRLGPVALEHRRRKHNKRSLKCHLTLNLP